MEILSTIVSTALLLGLIGSPILIFVGLNKSRIRCRFLIYLIPGVIVTAGITLAFAWWSDTSNQMLLNHYGYDFNAMNETDRFENVAGKNLEQVKKLEASFFGIGWPLKAILTYIFYSPYLLIVYLAGQLIIKRTYT